MSAGRPDAARVLELCRAQGWTLGVAESLTGGALTSALVEVPGASAVLRGGVVAYATDLKARLLGVDGELLSRLGPVAGPTALAMAAGVRRATGSDVGVATTGVAGPDPQDGHAPGLVFVAVVAPGSTVVRELHLDGGRAAVRASAVDAALTLALDVLREPGGVGAGGPEISPRA
ncbi:CinA family protein [Luteimicrobium sp. NPDC057192]|uniref:CinA family protein n=1 Tax=Luteimicrobium sp. NPDC057192 TaxID=3346042 RepID=UPI0036439EC4